MTLLEGFFKVKHNLKQLIHIEDMLGYFFDELEYCNWVNQIKNGTLVELENGQRHSEEDFPSLPQKAVHDPQSRLTKMRKAMFEV